MKGLFRKTGRKIINLHFCFILLATDIRLLILAILVITYKEAIAAETGAACGSIPHGGSKAHEKSCSHFLVCTNGVLFETACPQNYGYNRSTNKCEYNSDCWANNGLNPGKSKICANHPTGSYLPSITGCRSFYYCYKGYAIPSNCPVGYAFRPLVSTCVVSDLECAKKN